MFGGVEIERPGGVGDGRIHNGTSCVQKVNTSPANRDSARIEDLPPHHLAACRRRVKESAEANRD